MATARKTMVATLLVAVTACEKTVMQAVTVIRLTREATREESEVLEVSMGTAA